jgi:hypothetical protein
MTTGHGKGLAAVTTVVLAFLGTAAWSGDDCSAVQGDVVLEARTPQVDLFSDASGTQKAMTLDKGKFPGCTPIIGRAPNMMLQVQIGGQKYWVAPHMVRYRFAGKLPAVCRNLALGANQQETGATRGLGEGCPPPGGSH